MFPAVSGRAGEAALFHDGAEFDLELIESTVLDGRTQKLVYIPHLHGEIPEGVGPQRRNADWAVWRDRRRGVVTWRGHRTEPAAATTAAAFALPP
jgi:hypothetical protein